ncbi:MAG: hypothetical protein WAW41_04680 [Methylobacter sp.]
MPKERFHTDLRPFAILYAGIIESLENLDEEELKKLADSCTKTTGTNCWFATHRVAAWIAPLVADQIEQRSIRGKKQDPGIFQQIGVHEPDITINGNLLTQAQSMTIRVAVYSFAERLQDEGLGDDQTGKDITANYLARLKEIAIMMDETAVGLVTP